MFLQRLIWLRQKIIVGQKLFQWMQGKIMGLSQSAQAIAFVLVSTIAFLVSMYTISILFYFAAGISAVGFLCSYLNKDKK